ncbi:MAG: hypothetical protein ACRD3K_00645, partial [Edaphobacter sp.]
MKKTLGSMEDASEIRARLQTIRVDDTAHWGKMTAKQMARHLGCAYEVALGERTVDPVKGIPPVAMKWAALRSGMRWPKNIQTVPELKRAIAEPTDDQFGELVEAAIAKMEELARGTHWAATHPMFGSMSAKDWMRWGYLHADHH